MTPSSATHANFTIERTYPRAPDEVFAAWADAPAKSSWFTGPEEWTSDPHELDFRVGGRERISTKVPGGPVHTYEATYNDIVPDRRIVSTYAMYQDDVRTSVSLATVELVPEAAGTRLTYTEQAVFFDDLDNAKDREEGTQVLFDKLAAHLAGTGR